MLDRKQNLNKLIRIVKLANARKARRIKPSETTKQADHRVTAQAVTSRPKEAPRSPLTDTEALTRKVRAEMVRDAQAAFAAVMTELNASQARSAPHEHNDCEDAEEPDEVIDSQRLIQADRVGEA